MSIESEHDLRTLQRVGRVVAETIAEARRRLRPGMTTAELDGYAITFERVTDPAPSLPRLPL